MLFKRLRRLFRKRSRSPYDRSTDRIYNNMDSTIIDLRHQLMQKTEEHRWEIERIKEESTTASSHLLRQSREQLKAAREMISQLKVDHENARIAAIPKCEACRNPFQQSALKAPRVLACGHSICFSCARDNCHNSTANAEFVKCPFDDTETPLAEGIFKLTKNLALITVISNANEQRRAHEDRLNNNLRDGYDSDQDTGQDSDQDSDSTSS